MIVLKIILLQLIFSFRLLSKEDIDFTNNTKSINISDINKTNTGDKNNINFSPMENVDKIRENNVKDSKKKDNKLKFNCKPSFIAVGFDAFSLIYNLIVEAQDVSVDNMTYIDTRFRLNTDFNRIIADISFGILNSNSELKQKNEKNSKKGFFLNPNVFYNFIKKNSERNVVYAGGGFNFNRINYEHKNTSNNDNNFKETYYNIWFNAEGGCKTNIISFLHMGVALKFNFLRFQIKNKSDFSNIRKVSFDPFIYGFGPYNASYNIEFSIYLYLNINLFNDEKVIRRESYLEI